MKKVLFFIIPALFIGCSIKQDTIQNFAKCYIHKAPAPFWVCYQNSFISVGKVYTNEVDRLKQQEAYTMAISNLIKKLTLKTDEFVKRLDLNISLKEKIKEYVLFKGIQDSLWYDKKNRMLYVKVYIEKEDFKKFLFSFFKKIDKNKLNQTFDEVF